MAGGDEDQYCFAWPATNSIINANCYITSQESHAQYLFIKIHAELCYDIVDIEEEAEEEEDHDYLLIGKRDSKSNISQFLVPTDKLECDVNTWWSNISDILSRVGVSLEHQPFIIRQSLFVLISWLGTLVTWTARYCQWLSPSVPSQIHKSFKKSMQYESEESVEATSRRVEVKRRFGFNLLIQEMFRIKDGRLISTKTR